MLKIKLELDGEEYTVDIRLPDTLEELHFFHFDLRDCLYTIQIEILKKRFNLTEPFDDKHLIRLNGYDN